MTLAVESLDVPASDLSQVTSSFDAALFEVPTGREEAWRFTPMRRLRGVHERIDMTTSPTYLAPKTTIGVTAREVTKDDPAAAMAIPPTDRVSALAWQALRGVLVLEVSETASPDDPILVTVVSEGQGQTCGHVIVNVAANTSATVIIDHVGAGIYAGDTSVRLGAGAQATVLTMQRMDDGAALVGHVRARIGRDASLRAAVVTLGGDLVRLSTSVGYDGPGGSAELLGAFFTSAGQHQEHRIFVDHSAPNCVSDVAYKGALAGKKAHSVWIGDVLIRAGATGTQTYELNRNLVLTEGARADAVPNLEIETGEIVGAGHAAATGRFDEEQLFYLQSRGITSAEARRLVVRGFFSDVVRRMRVPEVGQRLLATVDEKLGQLSPDAGA